MNRLRQRLGRRAAAASAGEEGSVLLLTLGFGILAIAVILVCACATTMYLAQKRLDALADAAALAGADGFTITVEGPSVRAELDDGSVRDQAQAIVDAAGEGAELVSASTPDGVSARVTVRDTWRPAIFAPFVPDGVPLQSTSTSRTALR